MDLKRSVLIGVLLILTYVIILQWNKDYENDAYISETETSQIQLDISDTDNSNSVQMIHVKTDVLDLLINPIGGDIDNLKLLPYPVSLGSNQPLTIFNNNQSHLYIAQSGLTGKIAPDTQNRRIAWQSIKNDYTLEGKTLTVDLTYSENNINFIKRFSFNSGINPNCSTHEVNANKEKCINPDGYKITVSYIIDNQSQNKWTGNIYAQFKRDNKLENTSTGLLPTGTSAYNGAAIYTNDEPYRKISMDDLNKNKFKDEKILVKGGWVAWLQHYFVASWIPKAQQDLNNNSDLPTTDSLNSVTLRQDTNGNYIVGFVGANIDIDLQQIKEVSTVLYVGPKLQNYLQELSPGLELTVDYGFLWFIAQPIFKLLTFLHSLIGNWGWSIILLTTIIKAIFFYPSAISYRSMAKMKAVAPKMQDIKDRYADDREKQSKAIMELYQKEKINPMGSCLPILLQMPVFLSLYWVILESVEIRQAPWLGWITDLSIKDPFFILPIIMGVSMFVQQLLNPAPVDPIQQKVMRWLPVIFTFFFLWFPAGLVLYWVVNNILSILQQYYITKMITAEKTPNA